MEYRTHRGRRVRRATSWALRSCSQAGKRSFTHGDRTTKCAGAGVRDIETSSSESINDLHVWFRSFRVKLSRLREMMHTAQAKFQGNFARYAVKRDWEQAPNAVERLDYSMSLANSCRGSASITRAISMNSMTSTRRSPASMRPTKEFGRFRRAAKSRWVRPARSRVDTRRPIRALWPLLRKVFRRVVPAMALCCEKWSALDKAADRLLS
jgi:hypothetical protein